MSLYAAAAARPAPPVERFAVYFQPDVRVIVGPTAAVERVEWMWADSSRQVWRCTGPDADEQEEMTGSAIGNGALITACHFLDFAADASVAAASQPDGEGYTGKQLAQLAQWGSEARTALDDPAGLDLSTSCAPGAIEERHGFAIERLDWIINVLAHGDWPEQNDDEEIERTTWQA